MIEPTTQSPAPSPPLEPATVGSLFVANYPPFSFWNRAQLPQVHETLAAAPQPDTPFGLYLHLPFCRKRCKFCYFRVFTEMDSEHINTYLDALAREVEIYAGLAATGGRPLRFVYFGGGTPSLLSVRQLTRLVDRIRPAMPWDGAREVTFECEPGTLTHSKVEAIRALGVTRLSLGIENFDDDILRENGRAHLSPEIARCLPWIREARFEQLNVDLIAGMVGESWSTWKETVKKTIDVAPESVTIYQLELPYNTVYSQSLLKDGAQLSLADWETKRAWQDYAFDQLAAAGYEMSSAYTMVRRDKPCHFVYRDSVWQGCDMLGTGIASFSHVNGVHFQNLATWGEYLAELQAGRLPLDRGFVTSARERLTREMILQLKLGHLEAPYFERKFEVDVLSAFAPAWERLEERELLRRLPQGVEVTRAGLLIVDSLLPEFYDERYVNARYT